MVLIEGVFMGIVIMALVFPSPYGDYGSYLSADVIKATIYTANFRPLTGIMVLIGSCCGSDVMYIIGFPSPYGDYGSYPHPL